MHTTRCSFSSLQPDCNVLSKAPQHRCVTTSDPCRRSWGIDLASSLPYRSIYVSIPPFRRVPRAAYTVVPGSLFELHNRDWWPDPVTPAGRTVDLNLGLPALSSHTTPPPPPPGGLSFTGRPLLPLLRTARLAERPGLPSTCQAPPTSCAPSSQGRGSSSCSAEARGFILRSDGAAGFFQRRSAASAEGKGFSLFFFFLPARAGSRCAGRQASSGARRGHEPPDAGCIVWARRERSPPS